jgi:Pretoxin HINT domain
MTSQPRKYHKNGPFSRLPLVWLICCVAGGGWLMLGGLKPAVESHYARAVALTADDKPTYITKNIEDIQVGDWVLAKDPDDAGPPTPHRVIGLPRNWTEHVVHIQVKGQGDLQATRMHPFWVIGKGWTKAKDLQKEDELVDGSGAAVSVTKAWVQNRTTDTFNLTIDGVHTYYVLAGDSPVLVHNGYGSYTITFQSGMQYIGKGDASRAAQSAREYSTQYDDPVTNIDTSEAANDEDSFLQEEFRMRAAGGPGGNTYNQINSPGNNIANSYGCP